MLQQHATCLQQHLLTIHYTTAKTATTTNKKLLFKANKPKSLLSYNKHENLLFRKPSQHLPQRITQNLTVVNSLTENVALHSKYWQKTNGSEYNICSKQQRQRAPRVNVNATLATKKRWALKRCCLYKAKAQIIKAGLKKTVRRHYKPGLNSLKLRQALLRSRVIELKSQAQAQIVLATTIAALTAIRKSSKIVTATAKATVTATATDTYITNNSNMLPQQSPEPQHNLKTHADTLDFNSRRRRGRLRFNENALNQYNTENNKNNNNTNAKKNKENYVPATMFSNINAKVNKNNINMISNMFITILTTILINIIKCIKTFVNNKPLNTNNNNKTNKKNININNNNLVLFLINKTSKKPPTRSPSAPVSASAASSPSPSSSSSLLLLYAFLFALILLILPCHQTHLMAEAAKPKSATQQQQQVHQQHHQHQQDKPLIAYAAGDDSVHIDKQGMVLTPPSYQVVSSQTSNEEDAEYIIDSDERNFDLENESINEVNEEERDSYEKYDNGE